MNDADNAPDRGLTTEQIAAAGSMTGQEDVPAQAGDESFDDDIADRLSPGDEAGGAGLAGRGAPDAAGEGSFAADPGTRANLLEAGELQSIVMRWKDIQAEFVDEPRRALEEADSLVAELIQRLATMFASERAELEKRWAAESSCQVSTEELRQGLRRYRSFFERLLAA
jgi:hypothetical protein